MNPRKQNQNSNPGQSDLEPLLWRDTPRHHRPLAAGHRQRLHDIIFEANTPAGRLFDIVLLIVILASVVVVSLETVPSLNADPEIMWTLAFAEHVFTGLFAIEYALRLYCSRRPLRYVFSFWGAVDLLSFLPMLIAVLVRSDHRTFVILRSLRLLRAFRILKLWRMMGEAEALGQAVWRARDKIIVFMGVVLVAVTISGTLMYHVESYETVPGQAESGFTSIPQAMYWAIVTMTTVGYGDIVPTTTAGKFISAVLILLGYSLIVVPSGFVIAEVSAAQYLDGLAIDARVCRRCGCRGHRKDANYCCRCGDELEPSPEAETENETVTDSPSL